MALTLIATVGASNSNTYVTKAEASAVGGYWESRLFRTNWTGASVADRKTALAWATMLLDYWVDWYGIIQTDTQALRWPRYDVEDRDGIPFDYDEIPEFLKDATAELAGYLLSGNPTAAPETLGFSRIKVGSLELDIDKMDRDSETTIPDAVLSMVEPYGVIRRRGTGGVSRLLRA